MEIFYTPNRAWLGDVIPYAENGLFYLYYINLFSVIFFAPPPAADAAFALDISPNLLSPT